VEAENQTKNELEDNRPEVLQLEREIESLLEYFQDRSYSKKNFFHPDSATRDAGRVDANPAGISTKEI
jgi:hypothetical protein